MLLGTTIPSHSASSAIFAYIHYLGVMLCFGALVFERIRLKTELDRSQAISIIVADVIYGLAGLALLISGIFRVKYFGQGGDFYTHNPVFWIKIILFILVGLLSLYPTITYVLWAIPLSKGQLPDVTSSLVSRFRLIINVELIGFAIIPLFATLMARGFGL